MLQEKLSEKTSPCSLRIYHDAKQYNCTKNIYIDSATYNIELCAEAKINDELMLYIKMKIKIYRGDQGGGEMHVEELEVKDKVIYSPKNGEQKEINPNNMLKFMNETYGVKNSEKIRDKFIYFIEKKFNNIYDKATTRSFLLNYVDVSDHLKETITCMFE